MSLLVAAVWRFAQWVLDAGAQFKWQRGITPTSALAWPVGSMGGYLLMICLLKAAVQQPLRVPTVAAASHDLILCAGSAIMFLGCGAALMKVC